MGIGETSIIWTVSSILVKQKWAIRGLSPAPRQSHSIGAQQTRAALRSGVAGSREVTASAETIDYREVLEQAYLLARLQRETHLPPCV